MSQRIVFNLIKSFEDGATRSELDEKIVNDYPDRSLSAYLGYRLSALIEKEAVLEDTQDGKTVYKLNPNYSLEDLSVNLANLDDGVSRKDLQSHGIEVTNIVGSGTFCDRIDLRQLGMAFPGVEYEPETSPMAVWRPFDDNAVTVLIPSTGRLTIVGSKSQKQLCNGINKIYDDIRPLAEDIISYEDFLNEFQINNIAASGSLDRELDLSAVAIGLGLENTEYEPEEFPGIVYRPQPGVVTLVFRSGSVIITANSYFSILEGWKNLCDDLKEIGVELED